MAKRGLAIKTTILAVRKLVLHAGGRVDPLMALVRDHDLVIEGQVFPRGVAELAPALEMAAEFGCHHITIQADMCLMTVAECLPILEGW